MGKLFTASTHNFTPAVESLKILERGNSVNNQNVETKHTRKLN
jgi:hypothetical protein